MGSKHPDVLERIEELLIPALFAVVGVYALFTSLEFSASARTWPLVNSVVVVAGCGLLLLGNYLPEPLAALTYEGRIIGSEKPAQNSVDGNAQDAVPGRFPVPPTIFTAVTIVGYAFTGYLIGLLWASPIFVIMYLIYFERPWWLIVLLGSLSFGIAFGFMELLFLDIDNGVLTTGVDLL